MAEPFLEKLWRMLQCRDLSLSRAHQSIDQQLSQLSEKEREIQRMATDLTDKEDEIQRKEAEICQLAEAASERLELINRQYTELESIRRSNEYRFGYLVLNPWQVLKKRLFGETSSS